MTASARNLVIWLAAALAAVAALHSTLFSPGVPAFRHDWVWPFDAVQLRQGVLMNLSLWQPTALGAPNPMPINHPVFWLWYLGSYVASPSVLLKATLAAALACYAAGVGFCTLRFGRARAPLCAAAAAIAVLGPPIFNKLLAGHVNYLIALACFPWVLFFAASSRRRDIIAAGVVAALAALQIQVFGIIELVMLGIALAEIRRRRAATGLLAVALSISLFVPALWAVSSGAVATVFAPMKTITHWEVNNSAPFPQAVIGFGYFTHYAENAYAAAPLGWIGIHLLWIVPALAVFAIIRRREANTIALCVAFVALELVVLGLRGPLAGVLMAAFKSSLAFSTLRELYHFEGPAWTILCILGGIGLASMPRRVGVPLALIGVAAAALAWVPANYANQLFSARAAHTTARALQRIAGIPGNWSVLFLPAETPLGEGPTSGADPYAYPLNLHPSLNGYRLFGVAETAAAFGAEPSRDAWRYRHLVGVGAVVPRWNLRSDVAARYEPPKYVPNWLSGLLRRSLRTANAQGAAQIDPTCLLCAYDSLPVIKETDNWVSGNGFVLARDVYAFDGHDPDLLPRTQLLYPSPSESADPSRTWVAKRYWDFLDRHIASMPDGVLTWSSAPLQVPRVSANVLMVRVLVLHGYLTAGTKRLPVSGNRATWIRLPCHGCALRVHDGLAVVQAFAPLHSYHPRALPIEKQFGSRETAMQYDWRTLSGGGYVPAGTHWIVLKQRFTNLFRLDVKGGRVVRHVPVDGYANGWEVAGNGPMQVRLYYQGTRTARIEQWVSLAVLIIAALGLLRVSWCRPLGTPPGVYIQSQHHV